MIKIGDTIVNTRNVAGFRAEYDQIRVLMCGHSDLLITVDDPEKVMKRLVPAIMIDTNNDLSPQSCVVGGCL